MKTKGLSVNFIKIKIRVATKNKRQRQFNLEFKKNNFFRDVWQQTSKNMQKSSSLVDINNFNKTKVLSGNQALNKNSSNS